MGIYHQQVNQAAELSGNMSALRQLPKDKGNLQELWHENREDNRTPQPFSSLGAVAPARTDPSVRDTVSVFGFEATSVNSTDTSNSRSAIGSSKFTRHLRSVLESVYQ